MMSQWNSSGIFDKDFHRDSFATSLKVIVKIECIPMKINWTDYFHVYVQRHLMEIFRQ